jgi:hypothetical protein
MEIMTNKSNDLADLKSTNRLLRVMIAVLLRGKIDDPLPLKQQIEILDDLGLSPLEISKIINRENSYVSKELAGIRKKTKK